MERYVPEPKTILVTLGDPNGLGPELVCRIFAGQTHAFHRIVAIGPEEAIEHHARPLGCVSFWRTVDESICLNDLAPGFYTLTPERLADFPLTPGQATVEGGEAAGESLMEAMRLLDKGWGDVLVTCPLNKAKLKEAGFDFDGHTEFLTRHSGADPADICMYFWGPRLQVGLVTTHPPLARVPQLVTYERVVSCLEAIAGFLKRVGLSGKPIGVCGLNPHAGESGTIGREEIEVIAPAVQEARGRGIDARGPFGADTLFVQAAAGDYAAVLAMYHDQGLAPLKLMHFNESVNITLGLPFIRTSPAHGTGYDLVGKQIADPGSMRAAANLAFRLVENG